MGISIGQVKVNNKSNEITAIPELLDLIDISGLFLPLMQLEHKLILLIKSLIKKVIIF